MPVYPAGITSVLPGDQSFLVIAAAGTAGGAPGGTRIDHMGGSIDLSGRTSEYANSSSSWISDIFNKAKVTGTFRVAEDQTSLQASFAIGTRVDLYVKRSSNATTYDKLASTLFTAQPKEIPEDGSNHRTLTLNFSGGTFSEGLAVGSVPLYS